MEPFERKLLDLFDVAAASIEGQGSASGDYQRAIASSSMGGQRESQAEGRPPTALAEVKVDQSKARLWTITLAPPPSVTVEHEQELVTTPADVFGVKARIVWGSGGVSSQVDIDWAKGTVFALAASYVQVSVYMENRVAGAIPTGLAANSWKAFIVPGAVTMHNRPTLTHTVWVGTLAAAGNTGIIGVPSFAKSFWVQSAAGTSENFQTQCTRRLGADVLAVEQQFGNPNSIYLRPQHPIPLPPEATELIITNLSLGTAMATTSVAFEIGL